MDIDKLIRTANNSYQTNKYRSYRECYTDGIVILSDLIRQQLLQQTPLRCYVIMGVKFDNLCKPIELFVGENEFDILLTTDDFKDAAKYVNLESAEYVIEYLNNNYSNYSWHVVVSINGI